MSRLCLLPSRRSRPDEHDGCGPRSETPFRDNPRLIIAGIVVLVGVLVALLAITSGTSRFSPDFLSEFVLYALSAADLTMLAALVFVLARNVIKLIVERRKALPFARFRAKLVVLLLGMTLAPAVLVLIVGSELIRTSVDRWFNAPMDEVLSSANKIASDYYAERQNAVTDHATRIARALSTVDLAHSDVRPIRDMLTPDVTSQRVQMVSVYRVAAPGGSLDALQPVVEIAAPSLPPGSSGAAVDRLASQALSATNATRSIEPTATGGDLLRAAVVIRRDEGRMAGVVVATDYLTGDLAARSRRLTKAFEDYNQLRVLKRPLTGVYLSFFLMMTLLILVGSTWMGLYMAKRITGPVQAWRPPHERSGRGVWINASSRKATTNLDRWSRRSTRWPANWPAAAARSSGGPFNSSGSTSKWKAGDGTSKRFSSALRRAWCRSTPAARSPRSIPRRRAY